MIPSTTEQAIAMQFPDVKKKKIKKIKKLKKIKKI
jgi:hypothetical protein